jgi:signal transduction histidine kinase/DNA-binding NarL/FixJ family response regulator
MRPAQQIFRVRRHYNQWVGDETLEDYALRFTAVGARRWSIDHVAKTALGATAFLALEAISASVTLSYGFTNTIAAMLTVAVVIFITGLPITYYAAKHGLDIDLLTRGAGFGYLGSTITSLIYASFTFIFFAIEAAILASALHALLGIPPAIGYIICALAVIPIVTHGIKAISKFQVGTQSFWLLLQCLALGVVAWYEIAQVHDWTQYTPANLPGSDHLNLILFGGAASIFFAMVAQIGEQVDYLRFMPKKTPENRFRWWFWLVLAGPGWIFIGILKMLFGSFLAYLAISSNVPAEQAADPTYMYQMVFNYLTDSPTLSLMLAGLMVIVSQMKINVTNAYAGSIAWSNFFSRLTHSHPGRVVWLVFNVTIALILMELGIYRALESVLGVFAIIAISWLGCLSADLLINKPLGLSPSYVEFKRAHLYDINPVGTGAMLAASIMGILCYLGFFGATVKNLAHFISLGTCFVLVPLLALLTRSRFYLARQSSGLIVTFSPAELPDMPTASPVIQCCICENPFEQEDMSHCPAYQGPICSLCCSLDARCLDSCKPDARFSKQLVDFLQIFVPERVARLAESRLGRFTATLFCVNSLLAGIMALVYAQMAPVTNTQALLLGNALWTLFFILLIISGVITWLFLLNHESRVVAQQESNRQTRLLLDEIDAHQETDRALQQAKEQAESANSAKSRYLTGISHELRTPLQSILGYAQLLNSDQSIVFKHRNALQIIKRSGDYLNDLIEGLLDISKIEAGRLDIYRNHVKLPELVDQMVEMFRPQAEAKGIEFFHHIHNSLPKTVIADEKRLRQILINLLSNAVKYTEKGRVDLHIHYRNQVAEFSVIDTGVGIDGRDLERILQPFERVRNSHVPVVSGTGLGLTITRLLTDIMGGDLSITSTPGQGSCFTVSLMLSWVDSAAEEIQPQQNITGYQGSTRSVLVVDDEPIHRGLLFDLLVPLGFKVLEAQDAETCLEMLETLAPDLLLLDVTMPGMDGLELAHQLRKQGLQAPIVMLSADAHEHHRHSSDTTNHDAYLVKPVSNQKLLDTLALCLKLEWRTGEELLPETRTVNPPLLELNLEQPQHPLFKELLAYAKIGYKKGAHEKLNEIRSHAMIDLDTFNGLQQLIHNMRFDRLIAIMKTTE